MSSRLPSRRARPSRSRSARRSMRSHSTAGRCPRRAQVPGPWVSCAGGRRAAVAHALHGELAGRLAMSAAALDRLLVPRSIALIGGAWCDAVAAGNRTVGYAGELWRGAPPRASSAATRYYRSVAELPEAPDAAFIAVPNREVPAIAAALAERGAGGFVCFAAGFSEPATPEGGAPTRE